MLQRQILNTSSMQLDVPVTIKLDHGPNGKQTEKGDYQYVLNGNRMIAWLPPEVRSQFLQLGLQKGDEAQIVKMSKGGNPYFVVSRISDATEPPRPGQPEGRPRGQYRNGAATQGMSQVEVRNAAFLADRGRQQPQQTAVQPAPVIRTVYRAAEPQPAAQLEPEERLRPAAGHLMSCMCAAIDTAAEAQEYARKKGLGLTFLGGDIRALALSIYIGDRRNDQRNDWRNEE